MEMNNEGTDGPTDVQVFELTMDNDENQDELNRSLRKPWSEHMLKTYTANYTKISSGYMGQLVEWPEVITEGKNLEDCRRLLQDALREMIVAYRQQHKEIPVGGGLIEQIPVEI
jgi:predicted RNase H-like HicB family nuclease